MSDDPKQRFREMISRMTGLEPHEIKESDDMVDDLGVDSLKIIEVISALEKDLGIRIKDSELKKIRKYNEAEELYVTLWKEKQEREKQQ